MKLSEIKTYTSQWQEGTKGRFRLVEVRKGKKEKMRNKVLHYDWYYIFKYETGGKFALHYDFYNKFIEIKNAKI